MWSEDMNMGKMDGCPRQDARSGLFIMMFGWLWERNLLDTYIDYFAGLGL